MTQHRNSSRLFIYTLLLFAAAACMVLFGVESSDKSVILGSNLRRAQVTSRYLKTGVSRTIDEDEEESDSDEEESDSDEEEETEDADDSDEDVQEEETPTEGATEAKDGKETKDVDEDSADGDEDGEDTDEDSDEDEDEAPEDIAQDSTQQGGDLVHPTSPPGGSLDSFFSSTSTPQQGAGLVPPMNPITPSGGNPPQDASGVPPVDSVSPFGQPALPTGGVPIDPNTPPNQFGDTPFLGQGGSDWTTTTPPIGDVENWITPMEPTDEVPGYIPPLDNLDGQGGTLNQLGFPADGNGFVSPTNGQYGFDSSGSSSSSSPPAQGGAFNTQYGAGSSQYGNAQYGNTQFGNGGGKAQNKGGLAGAWKNMKSKSVEQGKSSLGEEIKEEEAMEEEEQADEMEGGSDDDKLTDTAEQSSSKPADADDEFEKMIEEAEGETNKEKGTSKGTKDKVFEDLDAAEKEEDTEEELEEVEEELKEEEEVAAAAGGMGFLLAIAGMIFTAHQMSENPDGVYASVCRLAITISGVVVKIICMPCRKVIGTGNPHYATHMPISTSADYGMGGANAGFEMS